MRSYLQPACLLVLALIVGSLLIVGCGSGSEDPNYKTEVKKTDEDVAREAANMRNQKAPGSGGQNVGNGPGTLKVPGKRSK
jgi:hypothetical protein